VAFRSLPGSRIDWEETHRVVRFNGMLPPGPGSPQGAVEFIAREGGIRVLGVHEIVEVI
jgi:hypothetical protein